MEIRTPRLTLRRFTLDDAPFILELVNDPDWIRHIGDRKVRSLEDARGYVRRAALTPYERHGFGLYRVERNDSGRAVGMCGLVKREGLDDVDIGFAFLPAGRGQGFAAEAAEAVLAHAKALGIERVVAVVAPANAASIRLLEKIGMRSKGPVRLPQGDEEILLFEA